MIIENDKSNWFTNIQNISIGECFYYADNLYLRITYDEKKKYRENVICVNLNDNSLNVFPFNISVTPVKAKVCVDTDSESVKVVPFNSHIED